jgi:hypothetical protein
VLNSLTLDRGAAATALYVSLILAFALPGCSPAARQATAGAIAGAAAGAAQTTQPMLLLFGGEDHKTYLGCLNCSEYASDSVLNKYGEHGSPYSSESIFNKYGEFGSLYSSYGACNPYATDPPVIVDHDGRYYGRLTLNRYHSEIGIGRNYLAWLAAVCT